MTKLAAEMADALRELIAIGDGEDDIGFAPGRGQDIWRERADAAWDSARKALAKYDSAQSAPETREVTDLDRAWRAVDALGGKWPHAADDYECGKQEGYDWALTEACAAIEKLGGRDVLGADASDPEGGGDEDGLITRNPAPHAAAPLAPSGEFRTYGTSSSPPDPDDWIEWKGGECPVGSGARVEVKLRNGQILSVYSSDQSDEWDWPQSRRPLDIIAYRLSQPHRDNG